MTNELIASIKKASSFVSVNYLFYYLN